MVTHQNINQDTIDNLQISIASEEVSEDKEEGEKDSNLQIVCKEVGISPKVISNNRKIKSRGDNNSVVPTRVQGKRLVKT